MEWVDSKCKHLLGSGSNSHFGPHVVPALAGRPVKTG